ncbi:MAG: PIN domain-containing protein [Saprospiraceae bacterium]|nr:PIN domain-containing protein [Saprospiraceae bacterium]HRD82838.1 PIN domain-containing protein [Saprospiraceae bacterium]
MEPQAIVAILDANVLYPAPLRDFLLSLAFRGVFAPKWSSDIQEEWTRNLLKNRPDLTQEQLNYTVKLMNTAFPDASVTDFHSSTNSFVLPDEGDRHVLATAVHTKANFIVTFNLKDFPEQPLETLFIKAIHPDDFIHNILINNESICITAFKDMVGRLKNPPLQIEDVLESLSKCQLIKTVSSIRIIMKQN